MIANIQLFLISLALALSAQGLVAHHSTSESEAVSATYGGHGPMPSGEPDVSPCIHECGYQAAVAIGCPPEDFTCICAKPEFVTQAGTCIQDKCPNELEQAETLLDQICASLPPASNSTSSGVSSSMINGTAYATSDATSYTTSNATSTATSPDSAAPPPTSSPSATNPVAVSGASSATSAAAAGATQSTNAAGRVVFGAGGGLAVGISIVGAVVAGGLLVL